ncbi:hypothetical protein QYF36_010464 [Acer negundo]|nr:hypothetical protein QYF36_010464 [Acer negundo]
MAAHEGHWDIITSPTAKTPHPTVGGRSSYLVVGERALPTNPRARTSLPYLLKFCLKRKRLPGLYPRAANSKGCWKSWNGNNWAEFLYAAKGNQKKSIKPRFTRGSPERQRGLADATARTSRINKFTLAEAIHFLLKYDPIGIFFLCWVIGFGGWWALLPQEALTQPSVCLDPHPKGKGKRLSYVRLLLSSILLDTIQEFSICLHLGRRTLIYTGSRNRMRNLGDSTERDATRPDERPERNSNSAKATKERKYIRAFDSGAASHEARAAAKAMEKWRGLVE